MLVSRSILLNILPLPQVVSSLQCKVSRQKIRATMTVLAVIVCLLICVLPVWCRALYILFYWKATGKAPKIYPVVEMSLHWLLFMHSSVNPCIYGLVNPQFQESFKKIVFFFRSVSDSTQRYGAPDITTTKRGAANSERDSTTVNESRLPKTPGTQNVACSILNENKKFLGLKFSTVENGMSTTCANAMSIDGESDTYFESTVQNTTNV